MNNNDFELEFDIDSILSEFSSSDFSSDAVPETENPVPAPIPAEKTAVFAPVSPVKPKVEKAVPPVDEDAVITHYADKYRKQPPAPKKKEKPAVAKALAMLAETEAPQADLPAPVKEEKVKAPKSRKPKEEKAGDDSATAVFQPYGHEKGPDGETEKASSLKEKPVKQKKERVKKEKVKKDKPSRTTVADLAPRWLISLAGLMLTFVLLIFILIFISPASVSAAASRTVRKTADIASSVNNFATQKAKEAAIAASTAAENESIVEEAIPVANTVRIIPEDALVAPEPLSYSFGSVATSDASEIMNVIQQARDNGLLGEDETVVFTPDVEFNTGSYYQDIQYYLDDTLMVICWKEIIDGNTCTFCEVKMQDGSQFRRKLAGDMFGSDVLEYTTSMHKATNAVVSMNADYYRFRDMGIVVYNRQLQRFNEGEYLYRYGQLLQKYNCVDTLFVTAGGNFKFFHMYEQTTPEEIQQFVDDNDILFSIAFGPVLVEDGQLNTSYFEDQWYPIGEIDTGYSRAGIGQTGELHYLYMSLNHSDEKAARWTTKEFAEHFYEKGVINAYSLDGGQTSEIVFQGDEPYNHVDHVNGTNSRQVSDMIYFASAVNGEEVTR